MIDSGATNNFMSVSTCNSLGLNYNTNNVFQNVRLADGKTLWNDSLAIASLKA